MRLTQTVATYSSQVSFSDIYICKFVSLSSYLSEMQSYAETKQSVLPFAYSFCL